MKQQLHSFNAEPTAPCIPTIKDSLIKHIDSSTFPKKDVTNRLHNTPTRRDRSTHPKIHKPLRSSIAELKKKKGIGLMRQRSIDDIDVRYQPLRGNSATTAASVLARRLRPLLNTSAPLHGSRGYGHGRGRDDGNAGRAHTAPNMATIDVFNTDISADHRPSRFARRLSGAKAAASLMRNDKGDLRRGISRQHSNDDFDVVYSSPCKVVDTNDSVPCLDSSKTDDTLTVRPIVPLSPAEFITSEDKLFYRGHVSGQVEIYYHAAQDCLEICCYDRDRGTELPRAYSSVSQICSICQQALDKKRDHIRPSPAQEAARYVQAHVETEVVRRLSSEGERTVGEGPFMKTVKLRMQRYNEETSTSETLLIPCPHDLIPATMRYAPDKNKDKHLVSNTLGALSRAFDDMKSSRLNAAVMAYRAEEDIRRITHAKVRWHFAYRRVRDYLRFRNLTIASMTSVGGLVAGRPDVKSACEKATFGKGLDIVDLKVLSSLVRPIIAMNSPCIKGRARCHTFNLVYYNAAHSTPSPTETATPLPGGAFPENGCAGPYRRRKNAVIPGLIR